MLTSIYPHTQKVAKEELGWVINFHKSELIPTQQFDFLGYRFDLSKHEVCVWGGGGGGGGGLFCKGHRRVTNQFDYYSLNTNVIHRDTSISRKDSPDGQITHETISVVPENPVEISSITGHSDSLFRDSKKASDLVKQSKQCATRLSSPCRGTHFIALQ